MNYTFTADFEHACVSVPLITLLGEFAHKHLTHTNVGFDASIVTRGKMKCVQDSFLHCSGCHASLWEHTKQDARCFVEIFSQKYYNNGFSGGLSTFTPRPHRRKWFNIRLLYNSYTLSIYSSRLLALHRVLYPRVKFYILCASSPNVNLFAFHMARVIMLTLSCLRPNNRSWNYFFFS